MIGCIVPGCSCPHAGQGRRVPDSPEDVEIVIERARECQPIGAGLSKHDKIMVAKTLTPAYSARHIAIVLDVTPRTVCRWRSALRIKETA